MSQSVLQLIRQKAENEVEYGSSSTVEQCEESLRALVADCMGRFVDLHQHHRDPLQAMMSWIKQLRGDVLLSPDRDDIDSVPESHDWVGESKSIATQILENGPENVDERAIKRPVLPQAPKDRDLQAASRSHIH